MDRARSIAAWLLLGSSAAVAAPPGDFDPGRVGFSLRVGRVESDYAVQAAFVLPNERLVLHSRAALEPSAPAGKLERTGKGWTWTAPAAPGLCPIEVRSSGERVLLNVFVLRPASQVRHERLDGYRIGAYPAKPFRGLEAYRAPRGFVEVRPDLVDVAVSPHFRLGQFLCKQDGGWPKYLVLREELVLKLEAILERVNAHGIRTDSFVVMSGYRTPWYNRAIGNRTTSSRHVYGGAADVFIDVAPPDGVMDDLDGDGAITKADADWLYDLLETWSEEPWWRRFPGGLASYGATDAHGPFVHVDARGYRARWGR